jgi:hypothetical protein
VAGTGGMAFFPVWLQWIDAIYDSGMARPTLLPPSCPLTL